MEVGRRRRDPPERRRPELADVRRSVLDAEGLAVEDLVQEQVGVEGDGPVGARQRRDVARSATDRREERFARFGRCGIRRVLSRRRPEEREVAAEDALVVGRELRVGHVVGVVDPPEGQPLLVLEGHPELREDGVADELRDGGHLRLPAEASEQTAVRERGFAADPVGRDQIVGVRVGQDHLLRNALDEPETEEVRRLTVFVDVDRALGEVGVIDGGRLPVDDRPDRGDGELPGPVQDAVAHHVDAPRPRPAEDRLEVTGAAGVAVEARLADAFGEAELAIEERASRAEDGHLLVVERAHGASVLADLRDRLVRLQEPLGRVRAAAEPSQELQQVVLLDQGERAVGVASAGGFAPVMEDRLFDRGCAPIVQVGADGGQPPERLRAEFGARGFLHLDPVGQLRAHVVKEEIRVDRDRASRPLQARGVAVGASDAVEDRHPALASRRDVELGHRHQHGEADEIEEVVGRQLGVGHTVVVDERHRGRRRLGVTREGVGHEEERALAAPGAVHRERRLLLFAERVGRDAEVIEERSSDEALDRDGLSLHPEAADEALIVVRSPADPITVEVVGIGAGEDLLLVELGDEPHAEEGDRVPLSEGVGVLRHGGPGVVLLAVGIDADHAAGVVGRDGRGEGPVGEHAATEEEVPIETGAPADHRALVTAGAEGDVERRAQPIREGEATFGDLASTLEGLPLLGRRVGNDGAEGTRDVGCDRAVVRGFGIARGGREDRGRQEKRGERG